MPDQKKVAIVGATGFTGSELVRLLYHHPNVEISLITSESRAGEKFSDVHPFFRGIVDQELFSVKALRNYQLDLIFLALPHGISMDYVRDYQDLKVPIIDLSGDFRLSSPSVYEEWYPKKHSFPDGFAGAAYGIPELFNSEINQSALIGNPGCYPTSVILGAAPLLSAGLVDADHIIADSKSGVTGAGVKAKPVNHFSAVNDNFKAYGVKTHRHSIEIQEKLEQLAGKPVKVQFTPHLLPIDRGILSTIYLRPSREDFSEDLLRQNYVSYYAESPFVRLLDSPPTVKNVRGTNFCDIYTTYDPRTGNIIVMSAIDNLVRGAAGQAIQNMNLIFGLEETSGLSQIPLYP